jgi:Lar family restriction alleviation protein
MPSKKPKSKRPVVRRTSPPSCSPIPCPFCGRVWASVSQTKETKAWFVFCNSCLANGPILGDIDEAIYAWNKRANPALEHPPRFGGGSVAPGCSNSEVPNE